MKVYTTKQSVAYTNQPIQNVQGIKIANQGLDNLMPYIYLDLLKSTIHSAIINTKQFYIVGNGLSGGEPTLNMQLQTKDILAKLASDITIYNGYALKFVYSKDLTKIATVEHVPMCNLRYSIDADGNINGVAISEDQINYRRKKLKPVQYPLFDPTLASEQPVQVYIYSAYSPLQGYYPIPDYSGGIDYISIDGRLGTYHLNNVKRGFTPTSIVTFPSRMLDEDQEREVVRQFEEFYTGEKEVKSLFLFGEPTADGEVRAPKIESYEASKNVDLYNQLNEITTQKIITTHQLFSPVLASLPGSGSLGGNSNEILVAYDLFYNKVIKVYQNNILKGLNLITSYNNIPPYTIIPTQPTINKNNEQQ